MDSNARFPHREDSPEGLQLRPGERPFTWKNLGEGDIDWPEVRRALGEIGYAGYVTTELNGGDAAYLKDVSARVDRFLAGQKPVM